MPLTKAQCTNCGGTLDVDSNKEAAICPFCNTPYIVEKAINLYKTENHNHIVNNITYHGEGIVPEEKLKNAYILSKQRDYNTARKLLDEYKTLKPADWRLWYCYYFISAGTDDMSLRRAIDYAPNEIKDELIEQLGIPDQISRNRADKSVTENEYRAFMTNKKRPGSQMELFPLGSFSVLFVFLFIYGIFTLSSDATVFVIGIIGSCICIPLFLLMRKRLINRTEEYDSYKYGLENALQQYDIAYDQLIEKIKGNGGILYDKAFQSFTV